MGPTVADTTSMVIAVDVQVVLKLKPRKDDPEEDLCGSKAKAPKILQLPPYWDFSFPDVSCERRIALNYRRRNRSVRLKHNAHCTFFLLRISIMNYGTMLSGLPLCRFGYRVSEPL
mmetsp:Transcript_16616/g.41633  ORF Transcript_16616/g.41633 Transcript_16616/m.41633 type:complete len:116 (+) Transcript_16616:1226-1573(+)